MSDKETTFFFMKKNCFRCSVYVLPLLWAVTHEKAAEYSKQKFDRFKNSAKELLSKD